MLRSFFRSVALAALILFPACASSQTAEQNMSTIIMKLQVGGMNWNRFYPDVKQVISQQTNGTGIYLQLRQLGRLQNVLLTGGWRLPAGFYYTFRSRFEGGTVDWQVASDNAGNILALSFGAAYQMPVTKPSAPTTPAAKPALIDQSGTDPVSPTSKSEACSMFPDLCPAGE
jgi:hypothetical protein